MNWRTRPKKRVCVPYQDNHSSGVCSCRQRLRQWQVAATHFWRANNWDNAEAIIRKNQHHSQWSPWPKQRWVARYIARTQATLPISTCLLLFPRHFRTILPFVQQFFFFLHFLCRIHASLPFALLFPVVIFLLSRARIVLHKSGKRYTRRRISSLIWLHTTSSTGSHLLPP